MRETFARISVWTSDVLGSPGAFIVAALVVIVWGVTGPVFGFSPTWQLVINTGTTIVTFLMVFLIQAAENRDTKILQLKLDELLRAVTKARTGMVHLEDLTEEQLDSLEKEFKKLRGPDAEAVTTEKAKAGDRP